MFPVLFPGESSEVMGHHLVVAIAGLFVKSVFFVFGQTKAPQSSSQPFQLQCRGVRIVHSTEGGRSICISFQTLKCQNVYIPPATSRPRVA